MQSPPPNLETNDGERQSATPAASRSRGPRRTWIAVGACLVYLVIACLIFLPTGPLDPTQLPGGGVGDPDEMAWFLAWTPWALFHGHNILVTHAIDVPGGVNLANNTSVPLLGIVASPITAVLGPIATFNALLRLALATSGAATFFLTRRWCRGDLGPFLAGALFAFSPALISHLQSYGHLDLVFLPLIPVCVWLIEEILVIQRHTPFKMGAALALAMAGEYLISAELFADFVVLVTLGVMVLALFQRHRLVEHAHYVTVALITGVVIFGVVAGYPIAMALFGPNHLSGPVQSVAHLQRFRTDLAQLIVPDNRQWLFPARLSNLAATVIAPVKRAGGSAELGGYIGIPLLVTAVALAVLARKNAIVKSASVMAFVAVVLSFGSRLQIDGHTTAIPMPEAILSKLPLLNSIVPARFSIFVMLALVVVIAIGVDGVAQRVRDEGLSSGIAPTLCALGIGASLISIAPRLPVATETTAESTSEAASVAALVPKGALVLTYPYADPPFARSMLWQALDNFNFTMLGGYANIRSVTGAGQLYPLLVAPGYVQEFLTEAAAGRRVHYPPTTKVTNPTAAMCAFIAESHVTAVLYAPYGPGAASVYQLFENALGSPTRKSGAFSLWTINNSANCGKTAP